MGITMNYHGTELIQPVTICKIRTIHYFEYRSDFSFCGEAHDFWELLCVDKGEVIIQAGADEYLLKKGEIIFHKPNEYHNVKANGKIAPNLVVISFDCHSSYMKSLENSVFHIGESERSLFAQIILEAQNSFSTNLNNPYSEKLERKETSVFGSEQLIKIYLEHVLILLIRKKQASPDSSPSFYPASPLRKTNRQDTYERIISYLEEHITQHITIEQICSDNLVSRSIVQKLFRENAQSGIIDYFTKMKIQMAKQLIRENHMNFTQISDWLGYTSIHYFSRQFKQVSNMTPTEYATSIKILSEHPVE